MMALLLAGGPEALTVPLSLFVVFAAAKIAAELFERMGQPGIVGEILAGAAIGPYALGWMRPSEILTLLAELGVMFLLFRVGLEVKSSEMFRVGGPALLAAMGGVVLPFLAGWGILTWWGEPSIEAIFMGAAMVATSVGITAQVLSAKGMLSVRASQVILAAAVIDDVLGLLVLAVVSSMAKGAVDYTQLGVTAGISILFTVAVATLGARAANRMMPNISKRLSIAESEFTLSIGLLFGLSVLAVYSGVAAIIGAFLAGMALSETVDHRVHELTHGVTELLVPFFLVGVGMNLDVSQFRSAGAVAMAALILVAAVLTKMIGCGVGALGLGRKDAIRVGVGMVPRGEVGMVVAQIGLGLGVIAQSVYGVIVFMSVATTLIAPPLLKWAYRDLVPEGRPEADQMRLG